MRVAAQHAADVEAVDGGHFQVEQEDVGLLRLGPTRAHGVVDGSTWKPRAPRVRA